MRTMRLFLMLGLAGLLMRCSDDDTLPNQQDGAAVDAANSGDATQVSFQAQIQPIFTNSCATANCHSGDAPKAGLSLEDGRSNASLVGVPSQQCATLNLVQAAAPGRSYLVQKVEGEGDCFDRQKMPPGGSLTNEQIALIRSWIRAGANP